MGIVSNIYLIDCLEYMKTIPDKYFNLAICDPPYGIGFSDYERYSRRTKTKKRYTETGEKKWDNDIPIKEYFFELIRISKEQIIFGGNYFTCLTGDETPNLKTIQQFKKYIEKSKQNWIFWYKKNPVPNFADGELAWSSFGYNEQIDLMYYGNVGRDRIQIHPTQKPIYLYKIILNKYAKQGDKIFDSHMGSGSSVIAACEMDFEITACEIDKDYFEGAKKRIENHLLQLDIFKNKPEIIFNI